MEDKKITTDGIELIPVWQVLYQQAWQKRAGDNRFWILRNPDADQQKANWVGQHTFKDKQKAVDALNALIRDHSKGARIETTVCGGIGVDIAIDEDTANDERIVNWKIRKQYKTPWELDEEMEALK